jgi:hypothetical protein
MITAQRAPRLVVMLCIASLAACAQDQDGDGSWGEYRSERFGYSIAYPGDWTLVEARPREREMIRVSEFLEPGELEKLTFLEPPGGAWRGQFELRVLPNPERQSLDQWLEGLKLANLSFVNMIDTKLARLPAKRWTRFAYDLIHGEFVTVAEDRAYLLTFDANREENPDSDAHQQIYQRMIESFALTGQ